MFDILNLREDIHIRITETCHIFTITEGTHCLENIIHNDSAVPFLFTINNFAYNISIKGIRKKYKI